jgi:hypothetical protein
MPRNGSISECSRQTVARDAERVSARTIRVDRTAPEIHHITTAARAKPQVTGPDEFSAPTGRASARRVFGSLFRRGPAVYGWVSDDLRGSAMAIPTVDVGYLKRAREGHFDLGWLQDTHSEWGVRARPSKVGLTMRDIAIGSYGEVPDHPPRRTMAPRGADIDVDVPDMGYTINDKAEVWADNLDELYEEAVSRQWSATRDIPWSELAELPPDLEHAMCQLSTVLSEVEMVAADFPAKWLWRINHDFVEAKMFLCTQVMDEARHTEVFRKRALANGGGLGKAKAVVERFLKLILRRAVLRRGFGPDAPARRRRRAVAVPGRRADRALSGREEDLPAVHAGRGPSRGLRHDASQVSVAA